MKKIILTFLCFFNILYASASGDTITYRIMEMVINDEKEDSLTLKRRNAAIQFYMQDDTALFFMYKERANDAYSCGRVHNLMRGSMPETDSTYATVSYKFVWDLANSYDDFTGVADVIFTRIITIQRILFQAEIRIRDINEIIVFAGYKEQGDDTPDENALLAFYFIPGTR